MVAPVALRWRGARRLRVIGEVDLSNADMLKEKIATRHGQSLTLDLTQCTFIDSTGLGAIIDAQAFAEVTLRIVEGSHVDRLIGVAGLEPYLDVVRVPDSPKAAGAGL